MAGALFGFVLFSQVNMIRFVSVLSFLEFGLVPTVMGRRLGRAAHFSRFPALLRGWSF